MHTPSDAFSIMAVIEEQVAELCAEAMSDEAQGRIYFPYFPEYSADYTDPCCNCE